MKMQHININFVIYLIWLSLALCVAHRLGHGRKEDRPKIYTHEDKQSEFVRGKSKIIIV